MPEELDTIEVVAAVILKGNGYLICQRPHHKQHGGLWEFPGGKVDPGESLADAIRRELHEELELEVTSIGETVFISQEVGSHFRINFINTEARGNPILCEHEDIRFCTVDELKKLPLAPIDREFVLNLEAHQ